jgi:hypothetical protein
MVKSMNLTEIFLKQLLASISAVATQKLQKQKRSSNYEELVMYTNRLPIIEIIIATGGEINSDEIGADGLEVLTVLQDGENFTIIEGNELIQNALADSFRHLNSEYHTAVLFAVNLRVVPSHSNS